MELPTNLNQLIEDTPFGKVSIDIHRAYGTTQMVKARARTQVKTESIEAAGALIGQHLGEIIRQQQSGHLDVEITFVKGQMRFTIIEPFID
jgi:hypothetical protein